MSVPDEEKLGAKLLTRPFQDTISAVSAIPIKKRRLFFSRSPSPPPETQSSPTLAYDSSQNRPCLAQVPSLEAGDLPTPLTTLSEKGLPLESGFKVLANVDINKPPHYEDLIGHDCNDIEQEENGLTDTFYDGNFFTLKGIERPSASVCFDLPTAGENVRQEQLELQDPRSSDKEKLYVHDPLKGSLVSGLKTVSSQVCAHRSNWDLNMAMDTWEESTTDSPLKNDECDGSGSPGFGYFLGRVQQPNLMSASTTSNNPIASQPLVGEHLISIPFLSLHTSPKSGSASFDFQTDACLDLCLKPTCMPESYRSSSNLRKVDSLEEMKFLKLSMKPASSTPEPLFFGRGAVKPEPHGCIQHVQNKTEISGSETLVLEPIKSESHGIGKASRITVPGTANSALDAAVKPEPVEERDQARDSDEAREMSVSYISAYDPNSLISAKMHLETSGTHTMTSSTKHNSFIKDVILQTPRECHSTLKIEVDSMAQVKQTTDLFRNNKRCYSAVSSVSTIPQPEIGFAMQSLVDETRELISKKQASTEGSEHTGFFVKRRLQEGVNVKVLSESCEQYDTSVYLLQESSDEKAKVVCRTSLNETDARTRRGVDAFLNSDDVILQTSNEYPSTPKYEMNSMAQVEEERKFISVEEASNAGCERAGFFIKCRLYEGQNTKLLSESCEQDDIAVDILQGSSDEKAEVVSHMSSSETNSKIRLEFDQTNNELFCMMEEQGDNESKLRNSHVIDGVMHAHLENGRVDHNYEDGELRDGASLSANGGSHLTIDIEKAEVCTRSLNDASAAMSSSNEYVKHTSLESSEMYGDPGAVECINDVDPATATDMQESSSVTGDSSGKKTIGTTWNGQQDSLTKDKDFKRKTKFDRDPTIVSMDNTGEGNSVMENAGGSVKSSFPLSGEPKRDAVDRGRSGRIINLSSASSRNMKLIHEGPLSSRVERGNSTYRSFKWENCSAIRSRDEISSERSRKTKNENRRSWACGKHGSGSIQMRTSKGSDSLYSSIRDESEINQFHERNSDLNYMREEIHGHDDDSRHSKSVPSDACVPFAGRMSRKVTNELQSHAHMLSRRRSSGGQEQMSVIHHPTSEIRSRRCMQPDLEYVSQEKNCRAIPGGMLDQSHPHGQFERTDRIPIHRERLSLSPVRHRGPPQLSPAVCSPRSRAMSPSHWSPHTTPDRFIGQPEMVQCRSTRPRFTEQTLARRRGSCYGSKLPDGMMEIASSREHDFPRPRRDFPHKIQPGKFPGEYHGSSFARNQINELAVDSECANRRRYSEMHEPVRYRHRLIEGDGGENFSIHAEEGPPRPYRYHADDNQGFNEGGRSSREGEGRFKNRLGGNTSRRYKHIVHQQDDDDFRHQAEQGWNDSGFSNCRPRRRY